MANRITIYGKQGESNTERLRREMRVLSMSYDFLDVTTSENAGKHLTDIGEDPTQFPKVEVTLNSGNSAVILTNPDAATLRRTLFSEDVFGITSYWI